MLYPLSYERPSALFIPKRPIFATVRGALAGRMARPPLSCPPGRWPMSLDMGETMIYAQGQAHASSQI